MVAAYNDSVYFHSLELRSFVRRSILFCVSLCVRLRGGDAGEGGWQWFRIVAGHATEWNMWLRSLLLYWISAHSGKLLGNSLPHTEKPYFKLCEKIRHIIIDVERRCWVSDGCMRFCVTRAIFPNVSVLRVSACLLCLYARR